MRTRQSGVWTSWVFSALSTQYGGWDSHNYLAMMVDSNHVVHISGNMHAGLLQYFKSSGFFGGTAALTYSKVANMLASAQGIANEQKVTYPKFFRSPEGVLLFSYRSGSSGNGDVYLNAYDERAAAWAPFHTDSTGAPLPLFKGMCVSTASWTCTTW